MTVNTALRDRLSLAIELMSHEIEDILQVSNENGRKKIEEILASATLERDKKNYSSGWAYLQLAEQELIKYLSREQREIKANLLRIESEKFSDWRRRQIFQLLGPSTEKKHESAPEMSSVSRIIEALKIRSDYYYTRNHRMALRQARLNNLSGALLLLIIGIVGISFRIDLNSSPNLPQRIIVTILFGSLGACFSMANSLTSLRLDLKIPEQLLSIYITIIRLAIGSTGALIVMILLNSGLLNGLF